MKEITDEIKAAIEKNLPKQVGDVLAARLLKAAEDEARLADLKTDVIDLNKVIAEQSERLGKFGSLERKEAEIKAREDAVQLKEIEQKVLDITKEKECAEKIADHAHQFTALVFRSPVFNRFISDNTFDQPVFGNPNSPGQVTGYHRGTGGSRHETTTET